MKNYLGENKIKKIKVNIEARDMMNEVFRVQIVTDKVTGYDLMLFEDWQFWDNETEEDRAKEVAYYLKREIIYNGIIDKFLEDENYKERLISNVVELANRILSLDALCKYHATAESFFNAIYNIDYVIERIRDGRDDGTCKKAVAMYLDYFLQKYEDFIEIDSIEIKK